MKTGTICRVIAISALVALAALSCKKDTPKVLPTLTTTASNLTSTTVSATGEILSDGGAEITTRGFCWNTLPDPTTINQKTTDGKGPGTFTTTITGLIPGTRYYVRSYAANSVGTGYGNTVTVTTPAVTATLTTSALSSVSATSAICGGNILNDGGALITGRGVCWDVTQNPTVLNAQSVMANSEIIPLNAKTTDGTGTGAFTSSITGLTPGTTYYFRAYATNTAGTAYGNQVVGTTYAVLPTLTTTVVSNITESSFTTGGAITFDGGSAITARGVCWSSAQNPTIADNKTYDGAGPSSFVSNVTGLSPGTIYYVRAYATNSMGTSYGNQVSATSLATVPAVSTSENNPTTKTTATGGGIVTSDGGSSVTSLGVCWSTNPNPTILNNRTINGTGKGSFTSQITGLTTNTTYYVRAYATNSIGTSYGEEKTVVLYLNTPGPNVTDIDGNLYNSVKIGSQIWTTQNLKVIRYRNGNTIPNIPDVDVWKNLTIGSYCSFLNNTASATTYGLLYNYYAITDTRQICPEGWHVPTKEEWQTLIDYLGGDNLASSKVRASGLEYWEHDKGTNSSGFNALGGSWRGDDGVFYYSLGSGAYWWTNAVFTSIYPFYSYLYSEPNIIRTGYGPYMENRAGLSVRCVKD